MPSGSLYGAVVVAVAAVGVVEVAVHEVVHVVAVRHGFVSASGAVLVVRIVGAAGVIGRAVSRVRAADRQEVLVHVVGVGMMEVAVVQVVGVAVMAHGQVTAAFPVNVLVAVVTIAGHGLPPKVWGSWIS